MRINQRPNSFSRSGHSHSNVRIGRSPCRREFTPGLLHPMWRRYARTKVETLNLPLAQVPALTIASEPPSFIRIAGASQGVWELQFCATGEGDSESEARGYLGEVSMERTGSLISINATHGGRTGNRGDLLAQVPQDAPLTLHVVGAVELRNMSGPVRISDVGWTGDHSGHHRHSQCRGGDR